MISSKGNYVRIRNGNGLSVRSKKYVKPECSSIILPRETNESTIKVKATEAKK